MLVGVPPFLSTTNNANLKLSKSKGRKNLYNQILYDEPKLDYSFLGDDARDICSKLLDKDPRKRLGANDVDEIIQHRWFQGMDWRAMKNKTVQSPYCPQLDSEIDTKYFSEEFTQMGVSPENSCP